MTTLGNTVPRFRVGDWVSFQMGTRQVRARIIEDRGRLGVKGRRIFRLTADLGRDELDSFEMPEDDLVAIDPPVIERSAVKRYLEGGGLVEILRSNLSRGRNGPRVWLTMDPRGRVTHTFVDGAGQLGGAPVPFNVLHGDRIFSAKSDDVARYLMTFGLSRADAESVIREVGTAP